jgi:hypothetical protein
MAGACSRRNSKELNIRSMVSRLESVIACGTAEGENRKNNARACEILLKIIQGSF